MKAVPAQRIWLVDHAELDERWIQDRIIEDPTILGLGDLEVRDRERRQPKAGRLDLLLQDAEERRYELELQLGSTDESHIIRTIEYWDIERKRYPQYEHTAVIVAEDITARFLNVISLFNGTLPIIAIKLAAYVIESGVLLTFTTVLDAVERGLVDEDEEVYEATDRPYWEQQASRDTLAMTDELLEMLRQHDPSLHLKYTKFYIGLARNGQVDNFVVFRPKRAFLRLESAVSADTENLDAKVVEAGLDVLSRRGGRLRIRLTPKDLAAHRDVIAQVLTAAYKESRS